MLKLFRKIRYDLMEKNKTGKPASRTGRYLKYAVGEIVLVVIGILIALSLNNWNQNQGIQKQLHNYRTSLLSEIDKDLIELAKLDSINLSSSNQIKEYFTVYNSNSVDIDSLISKKNNLFFYWNLFHSNIYTIDELIASGNISLFTHEEKLAIITLKNQIELFSYYEKGQGKYLDETWRYFDDKEDLAYMSGLTFNQNIRTKELTSDKNSDFYKAYNNALALSLSMFEYQDKIYSKNIRPAINQLRKVLLENYN